MLEIEQFLYRISIWALPILLVPTLHAAARAHVAWRLGDDTPWQQGRVTWNPIRHIDPFGTLLLPGLMLLFGSSFLFAYAKDVPIHFGRLNNPRRDLILVSAAGPAMNLLMAFLAVFCLAHVVESLPDVARDWTFANLRNLVILSLLLAVLDLVPLPPMAGGRILMGLLPYRQAMALSKVEPYGAIILIVLIFILPVLGRMTGLPLDLFVRFVFWCIQMLFGILVLMVGG